MKDEGDDGRGESRSGAGDCESGYLQGEDDGGIRTEAVESLAILEGVVIWRGIWCLAALAPPPSLDFWTPTSPWYRFDIGALRGARTWIPRGGGWSGSRRGLCSGRRKWSPAPSSGGRCLSPRLCLPLLRRVSSTWTCWIMGMWDYEQENQSIDQQQQELNMTLPIMNVIINLSTHPQFKQSQPPRWQKKFSYFLKKLAMVWMVDGDDGWEMFALSLLKCEWGLFPSHLMRGGGREEEVISDKDPITSRFWDLQWPWVSATRTPELTTVCRWIYRVGIYRAKPVSSLKGSSLEPNSSRAYSIALNIEVNLYRAVKLLLLYLKCLKTLKL